MRNAGEEGEIRKRASTKPESFQRNASSFFEASSLSHPSRSRCMVLPYFSSTYLLPPGVLSRCRLFLNQFDTLRTTRLSKQWTFCARSFWMSQVLQIIDLYEFPKTLTLYGCDLDGTPVWGWDQSSSPESFSHLGSDTWYILLYFWHIISLQIKSK